MAHQKSQIITGVAVIQFHRRRKTAQQRRRWRRLYPSEHIPLFFFGDIKDCRKTSSIIDTRYIQIHHRETNVVTLFIEQPYFEGQVVSVFVFLAGCCGAGLRNVQRECLCRFIVITCHL